MSFRHDPERPEERAERLDKELDEAQRSLNDARVRRMEHLEEEIHVAEENLDQLRSSLARLRAEGERHEEGNEGRARAPDLRIPGLIAFGAPVVFSVLCGYFLCARPTLRYSMPGGARSAERTMMQSRSLGGAQIDGIRAGRGEKADRSAVLRWGARVAHAEGIDVPVGNICSIEADVASNGSLLVGADVSVRCGTKVVYRKGDYNGVSARMSIDEMRQSSPSSYAYSLQLEDTERPSFDHRARASIDTEARSLSVWRDGSAPYRLDLEVFNPLAMTEAQQKPLFASTLRGAPAMPRILRQGRVVKTTGKSEVGVGKRCDIEMIPAASSSGWSCRVFVQCDGKSLYGARGTGYTNCLPPAASLTAHDVGMSSDDGDPRLDVDLAAGKVFLADDAVADWSATIELDPARLRLCALSPSRQQDPAPRQFAGRGRDLV